MALRQPVGSWVQAEGGASTAQNDGEDHASEFKRIAEREIARASRPGDKSGWVELGNLYFDTHQALESITAYEKAPAPGGPAPEGAE